MHTVCNDKLPVVNFNTCVYSVVVSNQTKKQSLVCKLKPHLLHFFLVLCCIQHKKAINAVPYCLLRDGNQDMQWYSCTHEYYCITAIVTCLVFVVVFAYFVVGTATKSKRQVETRQA